MCKLVFLNGHLDDIRARPAKKYESRLFKYLLGTLGSIILAEIFCQILYFWLTKKNQHSCKDLLYINKNCVTLVKEKNQSNFYITPSQHLRRKCKQKFLQKCMLKQNYLLKLKAKNYNKSTTLLQ